MVRTNPISFLLLLFLNIILYMNTEITLLLAIKGCLETIIRNGKINLKSGSHNALAIGIVLEIHLNGLLNNCAEYCEMIVFEVLGTITTR